MELFDSSTFILERPQLANQEPPQPPKRKQNTFGKKQKKLQLVLLELKEGAWVEKPLSDYDWFTEQINESLKPKGARKKKARVINWDSKLTLTAYDEWLKVNYKVCKVYAIEQAKKFLLAFCDVSDCIEEGNDALHEGVLKVRNILQDGPLASGTFIQYTKIAIQRLLLDRNRRGYAVHAERFSGYRYSIEDEYNRGVEITDEDPKDEQAELTDLLVSWLIRNYESEQEVMLWLYLTRDGRRSINFQKQCKAMRMTFQIAQGIASRVMIYLQHHTKNLFPEHLILKLKS